MRLRIEQSIKGLALVEELASDEQTRSFAKTAGRNRSRLLDQFVQSIQADWATPPRRYRDIAGPIHRTWMRYLSRGEDGGLLVEVDRGERSATKAILAALSHQIDDEIIGEATGTILKELLVEVRATRTKAIELERRYPLRSGQGRGL